MFLMKKSVDEVASALTDDDVEILEASGILDMIITINFVELFLIPFLFSFCFATVLRVFLLLSELLFHHLKKGPIVGREIHVRQLCFRWCFLIGISSPPLLLPKA